jgi:hypothetical protein
MFHPSDFRKSNVHQSTCDFHGNDNLDVWPRGSTSDETFQAPCSSRPRRSSDARRWSPVPRRTVKLQLGQSPSSYSPLSYLLLLAFLVPRGETDSQLVWTSATRTSAVYGATLSSTQMLPDSCAMVSTSLSWVSESPAKGMHLGIINRGLSNFVT